MVKIIRLISGEEICCVIPKEQIKDNKFGKVLQGYADEDVFKYAIEYPFCRLMWNRIDKVYNKIQEKINGTNNQLNYGIYLPKHLKSGSKLLLIHGHEGQPTAHDLQSITSKRNECIKGIKEHTIKDYRPFINQLKVEDVKEIIEIKEETQKKELSREGYSFQSNVINIDSNVGKPCLDNRADCACFPFIASRDVLKLEKKVENNFLFSNPRILLKKTKKSLNNCKHNLNNLISGHYLPCQTIRISKEKRMKRNRNSPTTKREIL